MVPLIKLIVPIKTVTRLNGKFNSYSNSNRNLPLTAKVAANLTENLIVKAIVTETLTVKHQ